MTLHTATVEWQRQPSQAFDQVGDLWIVSAGGNLRPDLGDGSNGDVSLGIDLDNPRPRFRGLHRFLGRRQSRKKEKDGPPSLDLAAARRVFPGLYAEVVTPSGGARPDLDGFESRPSPLLADVIAMIARKDDVAVAARLAAETDPLAVLGIVTRVVDAKRVAPLLSVLRRGDAAENTAALLKLQVGLHALGQFDGAMAAGAAVAGVGRGDADGAESAVLEARSSARVGDRKRTEAALQRAIGLGAANLSEDALGDIARLGADRRIADLLTQMRRAAPAP